MGLGTTRRGAVRGNVKPKSVITRFLSVQVSIWVLCLFLRQASDAGRSASPASDGGNTSDDKTGLRGKTKAKGKKTGEALFPSFRHFPTQQQTTVI